MTAALSLSGRLRAVLSHLPTDADPMDRAVLLEACKRFEQIEKHPAEFQAESAVSSSNGDPRVNVIFRGVTAQISVVKLQDV